VRSVLTLLLCICLPAGVNSGSGTAPDDWSRPALSDSLFDGSAFTVATAPDPHNRPGACTACHTPGERTTSASVDAARCLNCHDNRAHVRRLHATDAAVSGRPGIQVPAHLPLDAGHLDCLTCHSQVCSPPRDNRASLRGGPFTRAEQFCFQCHTTSGFEGLYPHGGGADAPDATRLEALGIVSTCLLCHSTDPPDAGNALWVGDQQVCTRCHSADQHETRHLGKTLQGPGARADIAGRLADFESASGYQLPRDNAQRMACATCHLPSESCRPEGVAHSEFPDHGLRLPAGLLCLACHALTGPPAAGPETAGRRQP